MGDPPFILQVTPSLTEAQEKSTSVVVVVCDDNDVDAQYAIQEALYYRW